MAETGKRSPRGSHIGSDSTGRLSQVAENYLLSLYILAEEGERATAGHLAEYIRKIPAGEGLGTTLPSVLGMLRRMSREGLVELTSEKEVKMTPRGLVLAEGMARRHRLAERMVVDILGLELHKAHEEAHRLEHAISDDLEVKISEKLGNPTTCPFGKPIPGSDYIPPTGFRTSLDMAKPGVPYTVDRVPEGDKELLKFLVEMNVLPSNWITVVEASRYRGVITVKTEKGESALGYDVAAKIWVREEVQQAVGNLGQGGTLSEDSSRSLWEQ